MMISYRTNMALIALVFLVIGILFMTRINLVVGGALSVAAMIVAVQTMRIPKELTCPRCRESSRLFIGFGSGQPELR